MNLRVPGPTPCPPQVLAASARQMINHRGREFARLIGVVVERLKRFYRTENDVLVLTASGTGGLEAAIVNMLSPGDKVLAVVIGEFGQRFAEIAAVYGAQVERLEYEPGLAADPDDVRRALARHPDVRAVLVTHNETSTGVTNPLAEIAQAVREADKLLLVDAVSSLSSIPVETDAWGLDVVVSGSQKGWMVPPGLAFVSVSPRAWEAYREARMPRVYLDLGRHKRYLERGQTPWTPAVSVLYALEVALEMMEQEGMDNIFARHARIGQMTREGVKALGLRLLAADERYASNTVTAVRVPEGVDERALRRLLEDEYGVVLAGGQGALQGKVFRIGHLGWVTEDDIRQTLDALAQALPRVGYEPARA
ncbi:Soluble hydrogenase 42 kDa subunit [bacterium HR24]|nr:Soluble hydrogenase 42 kDa subunit [bacterium HR24]